MKTQATLRPIAGTQQHSGSVLGAVLQQPGLFSLQDEPAQEAIPTSAALGFSEAPVVEIIIKPNFAAEDSSPALVGDIIAACRKRGIVPAAVSVKPRV